MRTALSSLALLVVGALPVIAGATPPEIAPPGLELPPGIVPGGITGEGISSFWVLDSQSKRVLHLARPDSRLLDEFQLPSLEKPMGIAFDGSHLWVADNATHMLHCLDLHGAETRPPLVARSPLSANQGDIKDLSWDANYIWTAVAAGFASSFNQLDPGDGRVVHSFFANCNPVGLTVRGDTLWRLCDNGPARRRTLSTVQLDEPVPSKQVTTLHPASDFRGAGLFLDGVKLWTLDRKGPEQLLEQARAAQEGGHP